MGAPQHVSRVVGENVRRLRVQHGCTLDAFAREGQAYGLRLTSGRVADLESGKVSLTIPTLAAIAATVASVSGEPVSIARLMAGSGWESMASDAPVVLARQTTGDWTLADQRAARRRGISLEAFVAQSVRLWGHPMSVERDRRVAGTTPQHRGRITRQLLSELDAS